MTIIYTPSVASLLIGKGILTIMGMTNVASATVTGATTIFSGTQPSAATITSNWPSYNTSYLFHVPGVTYSQPNWSGAGSAFMTKNNNPAAVTALNTGTASWCIIWCSNIAAGTAAGQIGNATLPNVNFMVGPVTLAAGRGIVRLSDLSIISGNAYTLLDSTVSMKIQ